MENILNPQQNINNGCVHFPASDITKLLKILTTHRNIAKELSKP